MRLYFKVIFAVFVLMAVVVESDASRRSKKQVDTVGLECRGVMESFARVSDDVDRRLDQYSSKGFTHYFYSPSDDRYINRWGWKIVYNDSDRHALKALAEKCYSKGLEFVWTVNPGNSYSWTEDDYEFLLNKLLMMYHNGFRSFAVNFSVTNETLPLLKDRLYMDMQERVKQEIEVFVINELPVVEYPFDSDPIRTLVEGYFFTDDFISKARSMETLICNLSDKDHFSGFALTAVADLAKNPRNYSADVSLANGIENLPEHARELFKSFLFHMRTAGNLEGKVVYDLKSWSKSHEDSLYAEFEIIEKIGEKMQGCGDPILREVLEPYLVQFSKFGKYGKSAVECIRHYLDGNLSEFWICMVTNFRTPEDEQALRRYPVGNADLHTFCRVTMTELVKHFTDKLGTSLKIDSTPSLDADMTTFEPSDGHWECNIPPAARKCSILIGRIPEGEKVYFRELGTDGRLVAEFLVTEPYSSFDLKPGSVKVDLLGNVDIYETIFVSL